MMVGASQSLRWKTSCLGQSDPMESARVLDATELPCQPQMICAQIVTRENITVMFNLLLFVIVAELIF